MDISLEAWNTQDTMHISNDAKKKEGVVPGPGKAQCSSVGKYQDREVGRCGLGNRGREEGLWDFRGGGDPGKGKSFET